MLLLYFGLFSELIFSSNFYHFLLYLYFNCTTRQEIGVTYYDTELLAENTKSRLFNFAAPI